MNRTLYDAARLVGYLALLGLAVIFGGLVLDQIKAGLRS